MACGHFSGQPTDCLELRAKGVAFARKHAGSQGAAYSDSKGSTQEP
jgi:hypothetical protein